MSYHAPTYNDDVQNYFRRLIDFKQCSHFLLEAQSLEAFEVWFAKLELIDKRTLLLFLRQHKAEIRPEFLDLAQRRFAEEI